MAYGHVIGQSFFTDRTKDYKASIPTRSVTPGASVDVNGDLIDDIIIIDRGKTLRAIISSGSEFALNLKDSYTLTTLSEWSLAAGDLDNDGRIEFITSGEYNLGNIVSVGSESISGTKITTNIYTQGSATVDINNDGWLDYFVCNEDGPPKIYINDGTGNLVETQVIDFLENDNTDGSGNYGVVWADVNGDFLPDMVLSKCKVGVDDPTDLRRVNRVYINNGDGTFSEKGSEMNLNSGSQTWVTTVADYDNDGDMDAFVVNHYTPHQFMENIDNEYFVERELSEVLSGLSFQAVSLDVDNDGWMDIIVLGVQGGILLHNKGNMEFDVIRDIFGPNYVNSLTVGDYNDDGFPDIHAHLSLPVNVVGVLDDQLWMNDGNANHYIKINLQGIQSNRAAIGAHLTLYAGGIRQTRYVKGGESYGITNSFQQIFGLGENTEIDSLIIRWPSRLKEIYTDLGVDNTYLAQEGRCISKQIRLYDEPVLVGNSPVIIEGLEDYDQYLWSHGDTNRETPVSVGDYHLSMTNSDGCITVSKPINVVSGCFADDVDLIPGERTILYCDRESTVIKAVSAASYLWHDGTTADSIVVSSSGWVRLTAEDYCENILSDSVFVSFVRVDLQVAGDTILKGESTVLESNLDDTYWYLAPDFDEVIFKGKVFQTPLLDSTTVYGVKGEELSDFKSTYIGENQFPTSNFYHDNSLAGGLIFRVDRKSIIRRVTVNTDTGGKRAIVISNADKDTVFYKEFEIGDGITQLSLDATLEPGNYTMMTDIDVNQASFGHKSPRLVRTSGATSYPYSISDYVTIISSTFGATGYLYFYDWKVDYDLLYCQSAIEEVTVVVEKGSATSDSKKLKIKLYPNPTQGHFTIDLDREWIRIEIRDMNSRLIKVLKPKGDNSSYDISELKDGAYLLSVFDGEKWWYSKIIKL